MVMPIDAYQYVHLYNMGTTEVVSAILWYLTIIQCHRSVLFYMHTTSVSDIATIIYITQFSNKQGYVTIFADCVWLASILTIASQYKYEKGPLQCLYMF